MGKVQIVSCVICVRERVGVGVAGILQLCLQRCDVVCWVCVAVSIDANCASVHPFERVNQALVWQKGFCCWSPIERLYESGGGVAQRLKPACGIRQPCSAMLSRLCSRVVEWSGMSAGLITRRFLSENISCEAW